MYADIIVDISHEKLDKIYQYRIPDELLSQVFIGVQVNIPFGMGNRTIKGYVIGISEVPNFDPSRIKPISSIVTNSVAIENKLISLAYFIKNNFGGTMNDALHVVMPVKSSIKAVEKKTVCLKIDKDKVEELIEFNTKKHNMARVRLLESFLEANTTKLDYDYLTKKKKISLQVLRYFEEENIIDIKAKTMYRNPVSFLRMFRRKI